MKLSAGCGEAGFAKVAVGRPVFVTPLPDTVGDVGDVAVDGRVRFWVEEIVASPPKSFNPSPGFDPASWSRMFNRCSNNTTALSGNLVNVGSESFVMRIRFNPSCHLTYRSSIEGAFKQHCKKIPDWVRVN